MMSLMLMDLFSRSILCNDGAPGSAPFIRTRSADASATQWSYSETWTRWSCHSWRSAPSYT